MVENDNPILLPYPRSLTRSAGQHVLRPGQRIILEGAVAQELMTAGRRLQTQLGKLADLDWEICRNAVGPGRRDRRGVASGGGRRPTTSRATG